MATMTWLRKQKGFFAALLGMASGLVFVQLSQARDTDIYAVNAKQNCYILLDNSGSMAYGVYEQNIDYGKMYLYLAGLPGVTDPTTLPTNPAFPYQKNKIYQPKL